MVNRRRAAGRLSGWLAGALLAAAAAGQPVWGQEAGPAASGSRLRAADPKAARLLSAGAALSPTFRSIMDALEHSDLIVYVETRPLRLPGQLQFVAATPVCRHVRISIRAPGLDTEQIAWLAHELWHAVEIARASDVRDQAGLRHLYERLGDGGRYADSMESGMAQGVWTKVLYEVRNAQ
jgi:hypothetical protein